MPTILVQDGFRFFFFSNEGMEPPHVHVEKADATAKFWLDPLTVAYSHGFSASDLRRARVVIAERRSEFMERWHGYFRT